LANPTARTFKLAVLKKPALTLLEGIEKESEHYSRAQRLIKLLSYFEELKPDSIPPTSIIREFIGGSTIVH
jgi:uridine kinase